MMTKLSPDTVKCLREGSHRAFEEVFLAYYDKIKVFIFDYTKSEADAEELTADLFVKLWVDRATLNPSQSFNSYLHTIARNAALNLLKHKLVEQNYQNSSPEIHSFASNGEEELIAKETRLLIQMAVDRMPEQRKQIYLLSRNQGLKNEEIAQQLHTSKRNVESQLSLALKEIRKAILSVFLFFP